MTFKVTAIVSGLSVTQTTVTIQEKNRNSAIAWVRRYFGKHLVRIKRIQASEIGAQVVT